MAKLKAQLTRSDYDALDESLKSFYTESNGNYLLDAEGVEDVSGLKSKVSELFGKLKDREDILKQFDGLDAEAARKALAEMSKLEEKKLLDKQKFDEVLSKKTQEFEAQLEKERQERERYFTNLLSERRNNFLTEIGIVPEKLKALREFQSMVESSELDESFNLKFKDNINADDFSAKAKELVSFLFPAQNASGSGASGSQGGGGGSSRKWTDLSRAEKTEAIRNAGGDTEAAQKQFA